MSTTILIRVYSPYSAYIHQVIDFQRVDWRWYLTVLRSALGECWMWLLTRLGWLDSIVRSCTDLDRIWPVVEGRVRSSRWFDNVLADWRSSPPPSESWWKGRDAVLSGSGGGRSFVGDCGTVDSDNPASVQPEEQRYPTDPVLKYCVHYINNWKKNTVFVRNYVFAFWRRRTPWSQLLGRGFRPDWATLLTCWRISSGSRIFSDSQSLTWPICCFFSSWKDLWLWPGSWTLRPERYCGVRRASPIQE